MGAAKKVLAALLEDVKNYLDITWEDPDGDKKLLGILLRGMQYLERTTGGALDFIAEGQPRALLFDYCRYVRSNALDDFPKNYRAELLSLQIYKAVEDYDQKEGANVQ